MIRKIFQEQNKIITNKRIQENYFKIVLSSRQITQAALPGNFIGVRLSLGAEPLLRRPFSIHSAKGNKLEILYEVLGEGSKILSECRPGQRLDIIGPLGNGFESSALSPVLVGGGMGVAPLLFLAERLNKKGSLVLIGAKKKSQLLCEKEFQNLGYNVKISTDDGSRGFKGKVTGLLEKTLGSAAKDSGAVIYACGPRPMLKEVARICKKHKVKSQVSLEEHMACGIGACLGCAIKTRNGYQRVCKEGPVFSAQDVVWD